MSNKSRVEGKFSRTNEALSSLKKKCHVKQAEELGMKKRVFCFWELEASNFGLDAFTNPNKAYCILAPYAGLNLDCA